MEQHFVAGDYIQAGPYDAELLYLQNEHTSQAVWNGQVIRNTLQGLFSNVVGVIIKVVITSNYLNVQNK